MGAIEASSWIDEVEYVHLGASSISAGRNEVVDRATGRADLLAIIDDDELPSPSWLEELLVVQRATGADLVVGPVVPVFPAGSPGWATSGGFFDLPAPADRSVLSEGITGNALLVLDRVHALGLRFDEQLGIAGGEDQVFFRTAVDRGASVRYAAQALVHEPVPPSRLTPGYLARRELRKGNTLGLLDRGAPGWPPGQPVRRMLKAGWWLTRGAVHLLGGALARDRVRWTCGLLQVSRAVGMVLGLAGRRFDAYRSDLSPARPTVVFVAAEDPAVQSAGHSAFLHGFLQHFQEQGFRVVLLVTTDRVGTLLERAGRQRVYETRSRALRRIGAIVVARPRAVARALAWGAFVGAPAPMQRLADAARTRWRHRGEGVDHVLGQRLDAEASAWVASELRALAPQAVFFNSLFSIPDPLDLPDAVAATYVITVDVISERAAAFEALGYKVRPSGFTAAEEAGALRPVESLIAIQWDDAARLAELLPEAEVVVAPASIGIDVPVERAPVHGRCLFVGSGSLHNVDGIRWFIEECWPAVHTSVGGELHVVGTVCARLGTPPPGVVLRGPVDDLTAEYARAAVVVVPLRAGSGLKVKVVEAICHGAPIVSTSIGAQGMMDLEPRPFIVADTAPALVDALHGVLADERRARALEQAAASTAPLFSPERAYLELDESLRSHGVPVPPAGSLRVGG